MLERNLLSHVKLALLLAVLSWSILLKSRLVPGQPENENNSDIPFSAAEYGTALACIVAGIWEYYKGYNDLRTSTPFFKGTNLHLVFMTILSVIVFGTCVVFVIEES